ncbi:MAG: hypothetical protein HYZ89_02110 [Candidatus Omnitrophica bacterium]|nr:hypothetical protein [Candidatus Omnitrophota bacterium]
MNASGPGRWRQIVVATISKIVNSRNPMNHHMLVPKIALLLLALSGCEGPPGHLVPPTQILIAHALGGIDGITYTNSREAFLRNYQDGRRWFEVDLALTKDGDLVCFHLEQEQRLGFPTSIRETSTHDFLTRRIDGRYTPMTFQQLLGLVKERDGLYLVTDTKLWTAQIMDALLHDLKDVDPTLSRRLILQFYHSQDVPLLTAAERMYGPFADFILTLYQNQMSDQAVVLFVKQHKLPIVTMSTQRFNPQFAQALHHAGARVLVHTVNDPTEITRFAEAGADGFYTDFYWPTGHRAPAQANRRNL